jgi:hypothetical protein
MNLGTILHHPVRIAATVVTAGLVFAAGTAAGSEGGHSVPERTLTDAPVASAAEADTLWRYLGTLTPAARAQTILALNPNVRGALEAIVAANVVDSSTQ